MAMDTTNCTFANNMAFERGGAIYVYQVATLHDVNSEFRKNSAYSGCFMLRCTYTHIY